MKIHQKAGFRSNAEGAIDRSYYEQAVKKNKAKKVTKFLKYFYAVAIVLGCLIVITTNTVKNRHNGYYTYNNTTYYNISDDWYYYDDYDGWCEVSSTDAAPAKIATDYDEYFVSKTWDSSIDTTNWDESSYYERYQPSSDNDSDYDWGGNDSWDSDSTDWDSDW